MKISRLWHHLITVTRHKFYVGQLCFRFGLYYQGIMHDMSNYSWTELRVGAKYYIGSRSPNSVEREKKGYSLAWLHHKGRNRHHWEYWVDFTPQGIIANPMPIKYVVEMFCDRVAASKVYLKDDYNDTSPLVYYQKTDTFYVMNPLTRKQLCDMLTHLSEKGMDATVRYIRYTYLQK